MILLDHRLTNRAVSLHNEPRRGGFGGAREGSKGVRLPRTREHEAVGLGRLVLRAGEVSRRVRPEAREGERPSPTLGSVRLGASADAGRPGRSSRRPGAAGPGASGTGGRARLSGSRSREASWSLREACWRLGASRGRSSGGGRRDAGTCRKAPRPGRAAADRHRGCVRACRGFFDRRCTFAVGPARATGSRCFFSAGAPCSVPC